VFLHGLVGLSDEGLGVGGHVAETTKTVQVFRKLAPEVLEVLVSRLVVRINHPDASGVDQLRRQRLDLFLKFIIVYDKDYSLIIDIYFYETFSTLTQNI
jgi:hypothetical protein